jgi:hypothetical protein
MAIIKQQPSSPTIYYEALSYEASSPRSYETVEDLGEEVFNAMTPELKTVVREILGVDFSATPSWILKFFQCYYDQRGMGKIYRVMRTIEEVLSYGIIDESLAVSMIEVLEEIFHDDNDNVNVESINELMVD